MAKKRKLKLKKDNDIRQRLLDIEIDEISLVDKPAIEDEFIITKRVNGKGKGGTTVAKKKKQTKNSKASKKKTSKKSKKTEVVDGPVKTVKTAKEIQKGVFWKRSFKKDTEGKDHGDHCGFCGITKADETETIGMGLRCGVCFKCAVQHMEKDVVEDCIDGTFNFETFKEKHPGVKLFAKDGDPPTEDDGADEDSEDDGDGDTPTAASTKSKKDDESDEDESDEDESDEDDEDEDESDDESDESDEDESDEDESDDDEDESDDDKSDDDEDTEKSDKERAKRLKALKKLHPKARLGKVEKQLEDVVEMLAGSMEFHEQAVAMLSAQAELMMGALELILVGAQNGGEQSEATVQAAKNIKKGIKIFRETVQKAGAKISASRLATLRDIAEKLTTLIQSVATDQKEATSGKKGAKKNKKSLEKTVTELEVMNKKIASLEKSNSDKDDQLEKMANRLDDFEAFSGSSSEIDDDELDDEDSDSSNESVFKDFGPLKETVDRMEKRTRISTKKKGGH